MLSHLLPINPILLMDGYKSNHYLEMPDDIEQQYVVCVPRKASKYSEEIVGAGQSLLASFLASVRITSEMIDEAEIEITEQGYNFNRPGWEFILKNCDGKLPLEMYGVEEGRIVKPQTPLVGFLNTSGREVSWLPTYVETFSQSLMWKMSTVATICRTVRKTLEKYCDITGTDKALVNFMLHNFGDRGADSPNEAAVIAGIAHAMLFDGSDCTRANRYIKRLYNTSKATTTSIEATEHSVMCMHSNAYNRDDWGAAVMLVDRLYARVKSWKEDGIGIPAISGVIDTYNSKRFVRDYLGGEVLRPKIQASGGKLVCRPDSGDPTVEPGIIGQLLAEAFGSKTNSLGYEVLPDCVGVIQGDGIRIDTFEGVIQGWIEAGFSLDGFCLGMGSGVTHDGARDDFSFSMKAVAKRTTSSNWERMVKEPITDIGKKSLSGLVFCQEKEDGTLEVINALDTGEVYKLQAGNPGWRRWYADGYREWRQSFTDVQRRARS